VKSTVEFNAVVGVSFPDMFEAISEKASSMAGTDDHSEGSFIKDIFM